LATGNGKNNINGDGKSNGKIFRRRLTLNDADQNFATIRYSVTTLVNTALDCTPEVRQLAIVTLAVRCNLLLKQNLPIQNRLGW